MAVLNGGPLAGQVGYDPSVDPAPEQLAEQMIGPGQDGPAPGGAPGGGSGDPEAEVKALLDGAMRLAQSDGQVTEEEKLIMQQIGTLLQKLRTNRKKQLDQAIAGSPTSAAVGRAYA